MKTILTAVLTLASTLCAQQVVTLSVEGPASGLDYLNNRSVTRVKVGAAAYITFRFNPGDTPSTVAQRVAAGLGAQGIGALATGDLVRIVTGPNGGPLRDGVDFGTNDTGHVGITAGIDGAGPRSAVKTNGCTLPAVVGGPTDPRGLGGNILLDVDVERPGPAGPVVVRRSLSVRYGPNMSGRDLTTLMANELTGAGLRVSGVEMDSVLNQIGTTHSGLQVDRDVDGYPVRRIAYRPDQPFTMRWLEVHAGREPISGVTDYGQPWNDTPGQPLILRSWGAPQLGTQFGVTVDSRLPNQLTAVILGWARTELPLPMLGQGALLVVDPLGAAVESGIGTNQGGFGFGVALPMQAALAGVRLRWQALDMTPFGNSPRMSPALMTALHP